MTPPRPRPIVSMCILLCGGGCNGSDRSAGFEITLTQSEPIPTVFTATWDVDLDSLEAAWFELELDGQVARTVQVDVSADGPYETVLIGMKPASEYVVCAVVQAEGELHTSADRVVTTGLEPPEFPDLSSEGVQTWEGLLVTSIAAYPSAAVILDEDGDYVWWTISEGSDMIARSALSRDGRSMLFMGVNPEGEDENLLHEVNLDGTDHRETRLPSAHHDFAELPDGSIAYLAYDPRELGGLTVWGDRLMELDPEGNTVELYNAWDDELAEYDPTGTEKWPHANAMDYLPEEDAYLVSFSTLDSIYRIDRQSRSVDWRLGGAHSDFERTDGSSDYFQHQHQMQLLEDSILVFVNGGMGQVELSRAIELSLDDSSYEAQEIWEYWSDPALACLTLGDVHRFDNGNTLVTYSYQGLIQEVTPDGEPVWTLTASVGGALGYTTWIAAPPSQ